MDISVAIYNIDLKLSEYTRKVLLEGRVSQISDLSPFSFITKNRYFLVFFFQNEFLHFIKSKVGPK